MKNLFLPILLLTILQIHAQHDKSDLIRAYHDDSLTFNVLAEYPPDIRKNAFIASTYPQGYLRIEELSKDKSSHFKTLIEQIPEKDRDMIWELTRYPDLLQQIVVGGKKTIEELEELAADYPDPVMDATVGTGRKYYDELAEIEKLVRTADLEGHRTISGFPERVQAPYRSLVEQPELLSTLTDNMKTTVFIGDFYGNEPELLISFMDSLSLALAQQHAREVQEWKKKLAEDPQAKEEFDRAAREYAETYDFRVYTPESINDNWYRHPIPYWIGYYHPAPFEFWHPWPYWYYYGFYYGPGNTVIIINLPSYHFTWWYFHHHPHHYYYPHLSAAMYDFYYGHRSSPSGLVRGVGDWEQRTPMPVDWLQDEKTRVPKFREFGQAGIEIEEMDVREPVERPSRDEYIKANPERFPTLSKDKSPVRVPKDVQPRPVIPAPIPGPTTRPDRKPQPPPPAVKPVERPVKLKPVDKPVPVKKPR